jgi:hypothetical protein
MNVIHSLTLTTYTHAGDVLGLFGYAFVDLGASHLVSDTDGEQAKRGLICNITHDKEGGIVSCHDDGRHGLSDG